MLLDAEQTQAASVVPSGRQTVVAGPGAGKTEVVAELVRHLVEDEDVYPEDVLVISFSRAAVSAIRGRMTASSDLGHLIAVRTVDSLAAHIVAEHGGEQVALRGYDATIQAATRMLMNAEEPLLPDVEHVIVDEAQDIVGLRADFVRALLDRGVDQECGFSVLGDPAQSLYAFSESEGAPTLIELLLSAPVEHVELRHHYRARRRAARRHLKAREAVLAATPVEQRVELLGLVSGLPDIGDVDGIARTVRGWEGTTAILTRTNAQALDIAGRLRTRGLEITVQRRADEDAIGPWLAAAVGTSLERQIDRPSFAEALAGLSAAPPVDDVWPLLRHVSGSKGRTLDIRALVTALATRRPPRALQVSVSSRVVVSTVHRAKGLEFDNVVLVDPEGWLRNVESISEEVRVLYVALSRARDRLATATHEADRAWRPDPRTGRWFKHGYQKWQTFGVELRGSDTRALGPVDHDLEDYVGRAVEWDINYARKPDYVAFAEGFPVAAVGPSLVGDLRVRLAGRQGEPSRWPALRGGYVEALETVVDPEWRSSRWPHGLWLSARVTGLIDLVWKEVTE